jgi:hypothetical protein
VYTAANFDKKKLIVFEGTNSFQIILKEEGYFRLNRAFPVFVGFTDDLKKKIIQRSVSRLNWKRFLKIKDFEKKIPAVYPNHPVIFSFFLEETMRFFCAIFVYFYAVGWKSIVS